MAKFYTLGEISANSPRRFHQLTRDRTLYQRARFRSTKMGCIALASFTHTHTPNRRGGTPLRLCSRIAHADLGTLTTVTIVLKVESLRRR
jgi:hypothetical protein